MRLQRVGSFCRQHLLLPDAAALQPDTRKPRVKGYHDEYQPPAANAVISISSAAKQVHQPAKPGQQLRVLLASVYASLRLVHTGKAEN